VKVDDENQWENCSPNYCIYFKYWRFKRRGTGAQHTYTLYIYIYICVCVCVCMCVCIYVSSYIYRMHHCYSIDQAVPVDRRYRGAGWKTRQGHPAVLDRRRENKGILHICLAGKRVLRRRMWCDRVNRYLSVWLLLIWFTYVHFSV